MSRRKVDLGGSLRDIGDRYVASTPADLEKVRAGVLKRRRRRMWTYAAGAVAVASIVALVVLDARFDPLGDTTLQPADDAPPGGVQVSVPVPDRLEQVASSGDIGFVTGSSTISRVDPARDEPEWTSDVGGAPGDIVASDQEVWLTVPDTQQLVALDAATGEATASFDMSTYGAPRRLTIGAFKIRIAVDDYGVVVLDRATGTFSDLYRGDVIDTAQGAHAFWILTARGEILPLDPESGVVVDDIDPVTGVSPNGEITFTRQALWFGSYEDQEIVRINEERGGVTHTESLPGTYVDLDGGSQRLWLLVELSEGAGQLMRLDPGNAEHVDEPMRLSGAPADLSSGGDGIWVVLGSEDRVIHLLP